MYTENSDSTEGEPTFTRYSTPHGSYCCHLVTRLLVAVFSLLAIVLVGVSYGTSLARVHLRALNVYYGGYFDVYMWKLKGQDPNVFPRPVGVVDFRDKSTAWINSGARLCSLFALLFGVVSLVLSLALAICLCLHQSARQNDDKERENEAMKDHQERQGVANEESRNSSPKKNKQQTSKSHRTPAAYYAKRENGRRRQNFNVGIALAVFLFLTFLLAAISFIVCIAYIRGEGLAEALEKIFEDLKIGLDDDDIEDSKRSLKAGLFLLLGAALSALVGLVLAVIPPIAGWSMAGPNLINEQELDDGRRAGARHEARQPPAAPLPYGSGSYYPREEQEMPQTQPQYMHQQQDAVRGIPVALPGPPVETLNVREEEGRGGGYPSGNAKKGSAPTTEYTSNFYPGPGGAGGKSAA